jgi:hypothetical protein
MQLGRRKALRACFLFFLIFKISEAKSELNPKYPYASRTTNIPETIDVHIGVQPRPSFFKRMREKIFDAEREHEPANDNNETSAGVRAKKK